MWNIRCKTYSSFRLSLQFGAGNRHPLDVDPMRGRAIPRAGFKSYLHAFAVTIHRRWLSARRPALDHLLTVSLRRACRCEISDTPASGIALKSMCAGIWIGCSIRPRWWQAPVSPDPKKILCWMFCCHGGAISEPCCTNHPLPWQPVLFPHFFLYLPETGRMLTRTQPWWRGSCCLHFASALFLRFQWNPLADRGLSAIRR